MCILIQTKIAKITLHALHTIGHIHCVKWSGVVFPLPRTLIIRRWLTQIVASYLLPFSLNASLVTIHVTTIKTKTTERCTKILWLHSLPAASISLASEGHIISPRPQ